MLSRYLKTLLLVIFLINGLLTQFAIADAQIVIKAMRATTIAEIYILDKSVKIELEIGSADLPVFSGILPIRNNGQPAEDQPDTTNHVQNFFNKQLSISDDTDTLLKGEVQSLQVKKRIARDKVTGKPLAVQPETDEQVVFATLVYKLHHQSKYLKIKLSQFEGSHNRSANIGFVCYHLGLPVNDFRYLSGENIIDLDWGDPWYSKFRNRNLHRQFNSPVSAFLYVEPFEVRYEIIVRPRDLEHWVDLGIGKNRIIPIDAQQALKDKVVNFLSDKTPILIDGQAAVGRIDRIHFVQRTLRKTGVINPPQALDSLSATLGIIFVYPINQLPQHVEMKWKLFNRRIQNVHSVATDEAGGLPATLTEKDPILQWKNYLTHPKVPAMLQVSTPPEPDEIKFSLYLGMTSILLLGLAVYIGIQFVSGHSISKYTQVFTLLIGALAIIIYVVDETPIAIPIGKPEPISEDNATAVIAALLHNTYRAFDRRDESLVYDRLEQSVSGELLADIYLQTRRSIELENQGGARVSVKDLQLLSAEVNHYTDHAGFSATCCWIISGSVGHWGHLHQRTNQYQANLSVEPDQKSWKITAMNLLDEQRLETPISGVTR